MGESFRLAVLLICGASLFSCNSNPSAKYKAVPAAELHARARTLPLKDRYEMYLDVYDDRTPRNPVLASDVAALGEPARAYAISRADQADAKELGAILSLLSVIVSPCSDAERAVLMRAAKRTDTTDEALEARRNWIVSACAS
ncbi:MAG: hypothetical protein J7485_00605 [Sphingobium sp.]|nr:hypothetical protein [Sphingobium sp.]